MKLSSSLLPCLFVLFLGALISCDRCRDVDCGAGTCSDGDCECPMPLTGAECAEHQFDHLDGRLTAWRRISWPDWEEIDPAHAMFARFNVNDTDSLLGYPIEWTGAADFDMYKTISGDRLGSGNIERDSIFCTYTDGWNYEWRGGK